MACLTQKQLDNIFKSIGNYFKNLSNPIDYSHKEHLNYIYNKGISSGIAPATALSYVQAIPKLVNTYKSITGIKLNRNENIALATIESDFDDNDLTFVADYLGLTTQQEVKEVEEITVKEVMAPKGKKLKLFQANPNDPTSTTGPDERVDTETQRRDEKKSWYHGFVRKFLDATILGTEASAVTIKNHTGFRLKAIKMSEIPYEELFDFLKIDGVSEDLQKQLLDNDNVVALVVVDNEGNILKFNQDYAKSPEGKMIYFQMRDTRFDLLDDKEARGSIQTVAEIAKNTGLTEAQAEDKVRKGVERLRAIQKGVFENKEIILDITGGSPGYIPALDKSVGKLNYNNTPSTLGQVVEGIGSFEIYYNTLGANTADRYVVVNGSTVKLFSRKLNDTELDQFSTAAIEHMFKTKNSSTAAEFLTQYLALTEGNKIKLREKLDSILKKGDIENGIEELKEYLGTAGPFKNGYFLTYQKELSNYFGIKNGKLANVSREDYYDFWKQVLRTALPLNDDGKVQLFNSYLNFELDTPTRQKLGLEKYETPEPKKKSALDKGFTYGGTDVNFDELLKENGITSEASKKQIEDAFNWYNNSPIKDTIPFAALFNVINSNAKATWGPTGISLFFGSNFTDLYHEAWHGFSQLFLTIEQKQKLYDEIRKMSGTFALPKGGRIKFADATNIQIEELLAEDFRQYRLSDGTKVFGQRPVTNGIFAKIIKFLNWLFDNTSYQQTQIDFNSLKNVKSLYDKLYLGDFKDMQPDAKNVMFKSLASPIGSAANGTQLTIGQSNEVSDSIDAIISDLLEQAYKERGTVLIGEFLNSKKSIKYVYGKIKEILENKLLELSEDVETNGYAISILQTAIDDFGDINDTIDNKRLTDSTTISYHLRRSKLLDFKTKTLDESDEKNIDPDTNIQKALADNGELSFEDMANEKVLFLIRTLKQYDANGNIEMNDLGFPRLTKYNKTLGILIKNLNDNSGPKSIKAKLEELKDNGAYEIGELLNKLGDLNLVKENNPEIMNAWILFSNSFNTTSLPLIITRLEQSTNDEGDGFDYTLYNSQGRLDLSNIKRKINQEFNFNKRNVITDEFNGARLISKQKLINVFSGEFDGRYLNLDNTDPDKFKLALKFYNAIGIPIKNTLEYRELLANKTVLEGAYYIYKMLLNYTEKGKTADLIPNHIQYLTGSKIENQSNVIDTVLEAYIKIEDVVSSFSLLNAEGNRQYENVLNNTITIVKNGLNEVNNFVDFYNKPEFAHYNPNRNPMVRNSLIFKKLFGRNLSNRQDVLNLSNYSGIQLDKDGVNVNAVAINDTDTATKFYIDFYSYINNGYIELPRHADKKLALAYHTSKNPHFINPTSYLQDIETADDLFFGAMFGYLKAEHERIQDIKNGTISDLDYFPEFKNQGKEFLIFHDILTPTQKETLYNMSIEDLNNLNADSELYQELQNQISSYLTNLTSQNKEVFDEVTYVDQSTIYKLAKTSEYTKNLTEEEKINRLLRGYSANSFISFVESTILFYGDIAAYNLLKEEFHKRNASAGSTGKTFVSDPEILGAFNEFYGYKYAKSKNFNSYGVKEDGVLNVAIFDDIQVQNDDLIAEYKKTFEDQYIKDFTAFGLKGQELTDRVKLEVERSIGKYFAQEIKEGDGQGWLTFDVYRMLAKLSNEWSPIQEELYNKIVEGKEIGVDEVLKNFPPRKYQYYGPVASEKYHLNAIHKFSLMPLIPSVIKGKNLTKVHDRMMKNNVHYATFKSGSKTANRTEKDGKSNSFYQDLSTRTVMPIDAPLLVNQVNLKYLRNQVSINDEFKEQVVFSTQMRKLIINELFEKGIPLNTNVEKLVRSYLQNIEKYIEFNKQELRNEIELKKDGKFNAESLAKIIKREMSRRDFPEHLQEAVTKIENGSFAYDLSYALNAEDIEKILFSIVNKRIVKKKVNGEPLVQAAISGFESERPDLTNATEEQLKEYKADTLKFYRKDPTTGKTLPMQVKIALQGQFKKLLNAKHPDGKLIETRERLNEALKDPKWMKENGAMVRLTGVRIPVQGFNSMEMMEVAEFLEESAGNIVVAPTQIVSKSGGDFDIDKLSIFFPNIFLSKDKAVVKLDTVGNAGLENTITQDIINILSAPEIAAALVRPNDTDLVQPLSKSMLKYFAKSYNPKKNFIEDASIMQFNDELSGKVKERPVSPTRIFETRYNIYKQFSNSVGKKALGIGAVDNAYNALFNQVGLYLNDTFEHERKDKRSGKYVTQLRKNRLLLNHNKMDNGNISLSNIFNTEGTKISDLINQLINGWVDVAKDPWIAYVMGTPEASPSLLYLVQAGVPFKQAVYFLANPLVREYFDTLKKMNSPLAALSQTLEQNSKGGFDVISSLPENEFRLKVRMLGMNGFPNAHQLYDKIQEYTKGVETLTEDQLLGRLEASLDPTWIRDETDMAIFAHFLETLDVSKGLFKVKQSLNFDTKTSATMYDAFVRTQKRDAIIGDNEDEVNVLKIFPKDKLKALYSDTILHNFDVSEMQMEMFKDLFEIRNNPNLNKYLYEFYSNSLLFGSNIYDRVKEIFGGNDKMISEFKNDFTTAITLTSFRDIGVSETMYKGYEVVQVNSKEYERVINKKVTKSLPTDKLYFAKNNYTKDTAPNNPKFGFIFTENAEMLDTDYNVSMTQAVIRTNKQGEINPNALAIVTKKMQKAGANFTNSEADFTQFKELNTELINNIVNSKFERIIVPTGGFAMEKAKLPTRFAEWLQNELQTKLGITTDLVDRGDGVSGLTNSRKYEEPTTEEKGSIKMQPDNIEKIKAGTKTITNRTESEHANYKGDGIYTLPDGTKVELTLLGKAVNTDDYIHIYDSSGKVTQYDLDDYAEAEGFNNWSDFKANNKFSSNFVNGTQNRYVYSVEPIETTKVEETPTKGTNIPGYIPIGVYIQDDKMYVDKDTLLDQFESGEVFNNNTLAYGVIINTPEGGKYYLEKVSPKTFEDNFSEYVRFVMEREYQRSILKASDITNFDEVLLDLEVKNKNLIFTPGRIIKTNTPQMKKLLDTTLSGVRNEYGYTNLVDKETGEIFPEYENLLYKGNNEWQQFILNTAKAEALKYKLIEKYLTNKALKNILNSFSYLQDPINAYPKQLMNMLDTYPELVSQYSILEAFTISASKGKDIWNLIFKEGKPDANTVDNYNEELNKLSDISVEKHPDIHVNKNISEFFEKFQYYVLLSTGFSSGSKYALNSIVSPAHILNFTNSDMIKKTTNRILNNSDYTVVKQSLDTFTKKFLKNRLGINLNNDKTISYTPGFSTDNANRIKKYVAKPISKPFNVKNAKPVVPSDDSFRKANDSLYLIDLSVIREQANESNDKMFFTKAVKTLAETHDDKLFIFTAADKIPATVKASNISIFNTPEQIENAEFNGPVILPIDGLKGKDEKDTGMLSEALFAKFRVKNPGYEKGTGKLSIREMMNSDSFITSIDVINSIRIKSHAILDELNNSCNL